MAFSASPPMNIGIIASVRHPISEPFAGGLERHTHLLASALRRRGHAVTVFASTSADPALGAEPICDGDSLLDFSPQARRDASMLAEPFMAEHHAYLRLMLGLQSRRFDVVHNNALHYLPVAMAPALPFPLVTTLHTPPTPWLESAIASRAGGRTSGGGAHFVSVSASNARSWRAVLDACTVIPNGIDLAEWPFQPRGDKGLAVWTGRFVPEKGPHLAIDAAHAAGLPIALAGPLHDPGYFVAQVAPRLRAGDVYAGHLPHAELAELVGRAGVFLSTPCWDEPYGLVVAEALACGTPVAAFDRGAMSEILDRTSGRLAPPGDVAALAGAAREALQLDRAACRRRAEAHCSVEAMVSRYERLYEAVVAMPQAA